MSVSRFFLSLMVALMLGAAQPPINAQTPAEKAFMETFRKAYEATDEKTLDGLLYTKGADKDMIDMFGIMLSMGAGKKITSISIQPVSEADLKRLAAMTDEKGRPVMSPLPVNRKLVFRSESKTARGGTESTTSILLAEDGGKLVIPVPVPAR